MRFPGPLGLTDVEVAALVKHFNDCRTGALPAADRFQIVGASILWSQSAAAGGAKAPIRPRKASVSHRKAAPDKRARAQKADRSRKKAKLAKKKVRDSDEDTASSSGGSESESIDLPASGEEDSDVSSAEEGDEGAVREGDNVAFESDGLDSPRRYFEDLKVRAALKVGPPMRPLKVGPPSRAPKATGGKGKPPRTKAGTVNIVEDENAGAIEDFQDAMDEAVAGMEEVSSTPAPPPSPKPSPAPRKAVKPVPSSVAQPEPEKGGGAHPAAVYASLSPPAWSNRQVCRVGRREGQSAVEPAQNRFRVLDTVEVRQRWL